MKQSPDTWLQVCEKSMPPQNPGYGSDASPLFQAVMLVSNDLSEGCILIAGFEHVLGDATSYSMFLRTWSEKYEACLHAHRDQLSPAVLPAVEFQMPFTRREIRSLRRFFAFSAEGIGSLKDSSMDGCTTNDILMAQCACALAPIRLANMRLAAEAAGAARILVMADRRGRGISSDSWGNFAVDLSVEISWHLLASGNVATVARGETNFYPRPSCCAVRVCSSVLGLIFWHTFCGRTTILAAIRAAILYELQKLELDLALFNHHKDQNASKPKLLIWNTWSRVGRSLRSAKFGGAPEDLLQVEWLNLQALDVAPNDTIVAISPSHTSGLTVAVSSGTPSAQREMLALDAVWSEAIRAPVSAPIQVW